MDFAYETNSRQLAKRHAKQGFALLIVIWAIGLIALIVLVMITASRTRLQASANLVDAARAESFAEAGVGLSEIALTRTIANGGAEKSIAIDGSPFFCTFFDKAVAAILVEDEAGKVDLNLASPSMLSTLYRGFGASEQDADALARNTVMFTHVFEDESAIKTSELAEQTIPPKHAPMTSTLELDQVSGMSRDLFEAVLPYVTVTSRMPGIDPSAASPALLAALTGASSSTTLALARQPRTEWAASPSVAGPNQALPAGWNTLSSRTSFQIVVDVMTAGGSFSSLEVNVEWLGSDLGLRTREWRRGRGRVYPALEQLKNTSLKQGGSLLKPCQ